MANELVHVEIPNHMAKLNITYRGQQGDLPDAVTYDTSDMDIKRMAAEAVRQGYVPGINAHETPDFEEFVVDRFPAHPEVPYNRLSIRPKTAFGVDSALSADSTRELGIEAIIYLQKMAGIDEPRDKAEKSWDTFQDWERTSTLTAYQAIRG